MTLKLTPEICRAAYEYLAETEPFNKWNLPDAEEIKFRVGRSKKWGGSYLHETRELTVYENAVGHTFTLMRVMAHEMIHVIEDHDGARCDVMHSATFRRMAKLVCKVHGFDPHPFV